MASLRLAARRIPQQISAARSISTSASSSSRLRTGLYATAFALGTGIFAVYYFDARSAIHRYVITPTIRYALDPERGHRLAVRVLGSGLAPTDPVPDDARLKTEIWGEVLSSPIGVAAGFDKDGEAIDGLFDLGFSWVEIGSVTPKPQPGNPKPRVFHLPEDDALINRYGFPSQGHSAVLARLRNRLPTFFPDEPQPASLRKNKLLAVNLGKNKTSDLKSPADFVVGVKTFAPFVDALVINVSSPNTPGLRGLQKRELLEDLLKSVTQARDEATAAESPRKPKVLLKISPDLSEIEIEDIADAVLANGAIDGVIVSNTTVQRPASLKSPAQGEQGGLSGPPLRPLALTALRTLRARLPASVPIIGCGGIATGADALAFARAGASAVQVYTAFGYDGPGAARRIKDELAAELAREGTTWAEVAGRAVRELSLQEGLGEGSAKDRGAVRVLIREAEELRGLLDSLGERIKAGDPDVEGALLAVPPSMA